MAKRKPTRRALPADKQELKQQAQAALKRAKRRLRDFIRAEDVAIDYKIPELKGKSYAERIRRYNEMRRDFFRTKAESVDLETGELKPYVKPPRRKRQPVQAQQPDTEQVRYVAIEDKVLREVEHEIDTFTGNRNTYLMEKMRTRLRAALDKRISEVGRAAVAEAFEREYSAALLVQAVLGASKSEDMAIQYFAQFLNILYARPLTYTETTELTQALEYYEDFEQPL